MDLVDVVETPLALARQAIVAKDAESQMDARQPEVYGVLEDFAANRLGDD
jgi:hypothetical protein